jgi:hypothetical protein
MDHPPCPQRDRDGRPLTARLDDEWRVIRRRRPLLERARRWRATDQHFDDLEELLVLAGHHVEPTAAADAVLGRLVWAARSDHLAARVVLQRMLPGLLAIVRRRRSADVDGSFEQLLGAAWLVIHAYRPDLRPTRVAANLVRDASYRAFIAPARRRSATEVSIDPHALDDTPAVVVLSSCEELAALLHQARAMGLDARDVDFVQALLRCGSSTRLAAERNVTPRTIRNHRTRTAAKLRKCALVA